MESLSQQTCVACNSLSLPLNQKEIDELKSNLSDWDIVIQNGETQLQRSYKFEDFSKALMFTQMVGEVAEKDGHHPCLKTEWGKVTVTWWTHAIGGLHHNDFIMAAKTDEIANRFGVSLVKKGKADGG